MATTCKSCGAAIVWGTTRAGKSVPLDAEFVTGLLDEDGQIIKLRRSHFATCPNAAQHSKRGKNPEVQS